MTWRLDPHCELGVLAALPEPGEEHEDLGCGLQGPGSRAVRRALDPLRKRIRRMGEAAALRRAEELVHWIEAQPAYSALCTQRVSHGRRLLKSSVVYGSSADLKPSVLLVRHGRSGFDYRAVHIEVNASDWPAIHDLCSAMVLGDAPERIAALADHAKLTDFVADLIDAGWLGERNDERAPAKFKGAGIWFVGHNTAVVSSRTTRVIIDPWFRPWRDADPPDYRPLRPVDVGAADAILITHSHGDHFHLGSLLAFPRDTPLFVPHVERESILATDVARRLREVGFTHVKPLRWWETARVGDVRIEAMPFHGEQASSIALVDPELRNVGNTWMVRTPDTSAAFLADSGRDPAGDMKQVALRARESGPADFIFGGMRGFSLCPLFLPFTSLDAMFPNVPIELMAVRQRLMNDADDLLSVAEILGARFVVPYADGGSPWYWREGMGPTYKEYPSYPGERESTGEDADDPVSAPFPERLVEAAKQRNPGGMLVEPFVLRPGDVLRMTRGAAKLEGLDGFAWPYTE